MLSMKMWDLDDNYSGAWNLGPKGNSLFSVKEIVEKIIKYIGKGRFRTMPIHELDDLHESKSLILDSSKAEKLLGWKTILSIDETIQFLCDWYMEENINYEFDIKQIYNYFKKTNEQIS